VSDELLQPAGTLGFWTLARVASALNGGPSGAASHKSEGSAWSGTDRSIRAIATDSRTVERGDVFVALTGDRFDGHRFLATAVQRGASAVIVSEPASAVGVGVPVFTVGDTRSALAALARYRRRAWGKPVIAVAGSNGKTSTKELIRAALGAVLDVHATVGNYNNQVGVPLTLLATPDAADVAVVELGTNAPGEIALLTGIAEPDVAVVTSIGEEHLEGFGDLAGVLTEEASVFSGVGLGIVPADDPSLIAAARAGARRVVTAGLGVGDLRAAEWHIDACGRGELIVDGVAISVPLLGIHNLRNAMLALAVARACGLVLSTAATGIAAAAAPPMRAAWLPLGRATLINDAYNANPASVRAALDLLESVAPGRQRVAVLGTMRELGPSATELHADIAERALKSSFDIIAGVGEFATALIDVGHGDPRIITAPDIDELWPLLQARLAPDAIILLKASRGVRLERLVPPLTDWANSSCSITFSSH
jgi:UDP-N-acetylmuramoyl-tripeptide--D-alanyl-D-alanine ligase